MKKENSSKYYNEKYYLQLVKQDPWALQYIKNPTEKICLEALNKNIEAIKYIDIKKFPKVYEKYLFMIK